MREKRSILKDLWNDGFFPITCLRRKLFTETSRTFSAGDMYIKTPVLHMSWPNTLDLAVRLHHIHKQRA